MTPQPPNPRWKNPIFLEIESIVAACEADYQIHRKACERFHAALQKRFDAARNALLRSERLDSADGRKSSGPRRTDHKPLSKREIQILKLIAEGHTTKKAAQSMGDAFKTAVGHRSNLMTKLGLHDAVSLTRYAIRTGLIDA